MAWRYSSLPILVELISEQSWKLARLGEVDEGVPIHPQASKFLRAGPHSAHLSETAIRELYQRIARVNDRMAGLRLNPRPLIPVVFAVLTARLDHAQSRPTVEEHCDAAEVSVLAQRGATVRIQLGRDFQEPDMVPGLSGELVQVVKCAPWEVNEHFQGGEDDQGDFMATPGEDLEGFLIVQQERQLGDTVAGLHNIVFPELRVETACETILDILRITCQLTFQTSMRSRVPLQSMTVPPAAVYQ